jgi:hypothetical protein
MGSVPLHHTDVCEAGRKEGMKAREAFAPSGLIIICFRPYSHLRKKTILGLSSGDQNTQSIKKNGRVVSRPVKKSPGLDYAERRRRRTPHRISKPIPKSVTEAGSGTAPGGSVTVTV